MEITIKIQSENLTVAKLHSALEELKEIYVEELPSVNGTFQFDEQKTDKDGDNYIDLSISVTANN